MLIEYFIAFKESAGFRVTVNLNDVGLVFDAVNFGIDTCLSVN